MLRRRGGGGRCGTESDSRTLRLSGLTSAIVTKLITSHLHCLLHTTVHLQYNNSTFVYPGFALMPCPIPLCPA
jgi:hypothetical protein